MTKQSGTMDECRQYARMPETGMQTSYGTESFQAGGGMPETARPITAILADSEWRQNNIVSEPVYWGRRLSELPSRITECPCDGCQSAHRQSRIDELVRWEIETMAQWNTRPFKHQATVLRRFPKLQIAVAEYVLERWRRKYGKPQKMPRIQWFNVARWRQRYGAVDTLADKA